jgi:signal peptidase I
MLKRLKFVLLAACTALVMRACVVEPVRLTDDSMSPLFSDGDVAFVSKLRYGIRVPGAGAMLWEWAEPQKGDLVVAVSIGDPPVNLMRRISGLPGEKVVWEGKEVELKAGEYFLRAEKEEGVMDSRNFGPVPRRSIIGKVTYAWVPKSPSKEDGSKVESEKSRTLQPVL